MAKKVPTFEETVVRFWSKVHKTSSPHGCWEWTASCFEKRGGYGQFSTVSFSGRKRYSAHRFSWLIEHGSIPKGLCVLHRCDNPKCVNPMHLFLGTDMDNVRDMRAKRRDSWSKSPSEVLKIRQKMSMKATGERNPFFGRQHTEETKSKMRASRRR